VRRLPDAVSPDATFPNPAGACLQRGVGNHSFAQCSRVNWTCPDGVWTSGDDRGLSLVSVAADDWRAGVVGSAEGAPSQDRAAVRYPVDRGLRGLQERPSVSGARRHQQSRRVPRGGRTPVGEPLRTAPSPASSGELIRGITRRGGAPNTAARQPGTRRGRHRVLRSRWVTRARTEVDNFIVRVVAPSLRRYVRQVIESLCPQDCGGVLRFDLGGRVHNTKARCESRASGATACRAWWWWDAHSESWLPMSVEGVRADRPFGEIDF